MSENPAEPMPVPLVPQVSEPLMPVSDPPEIPAHADLLARISQTQLLPPALRESVEQAVAQTAAGVDPTLPVADVLKLLEGALPPQLRLAARETTRVEHPAGEVFFTGDASGLSDEQATQIARKQLERCGMLRG